MPNYHWVGLSFCIVCLVFVIGILTNFCSLESTPSYVCICTNSFCHAHCHRTWHLRPVARKRGDPTTNMAAIYSVANEARNQSEQNTVAAYSYFLLLLNHLGGRARKCVHVKLAQNIFKNESTSCFICHIHMCIIVSLCVSVCVFFRNYVLLYRFWPLISHGFSTPSFSGASSNALVAC